MASRLSFRFNLDKSVAALAYFASRGVTGLTTLKGVKLLYLADRRHFLRHGRPITGDQYVAMELGPVPEGTYQIVNRLVARDEIDDPAKARVVKQLKVFRGWFGTLKFPELQNVNAPDLDVFSDSELEVLDEIVGEYGTQPARLLVDLTHEHEAYRLANIDRPAGSSAPMPYDYFLADHAEKEGLGDLVEDQQDDRNFADALRRAGREAMAQRRRLAR